MHKTLLLAVLAALMALMLVAGPALWVLLVVMDRVWSQGIWGGNFTRADNDRHTATGSGPLNNPHLGI